MLRALISLALAATVAIVVAPAPDAATAEGQALDRPPAREHPQDLTCDPPAPDGRLRRQALGDGDALSFRQDPAWLTARRDQGLRLRRFTVAGDVARVRFDRWDPDADRYVTETWDRATTDTVSGRLVSIFEPEWTPTVVQRLLATARVGLDQPELFVGQYLGPADGPAVSRSIYARVGSGAVSSTPVVRLNDTVQYASHVVNLVVPGFGDRKLNDALDLAAVTREFYKYFDDSYDVIAIVPAEAHVDAFVAFHQRVRNEITGLGLGSFDFSGTYGSRGRLRGVEVFHNTGFGGTPTSSHELAHVWGHDFDWAKIAGITRAGHQPASHTPLISGGESLVSAVLTTNRRVGITGNGDAVIEGATPPFRPHPLDLYAMGLAEPADVPAFEVFDDQGQFSSTTRIEPALGTAVTGGHRTLSVNDVMAVHGARSGPVLTELRRATIVVSREELLPAADLAMWNFLASRHEDADHRGLVTYVGQGSFDASTDYRVDLASAIQPRDADALPRTQDPEPDRFGALDCGGFEFTTAPPTRVKAGQRFTVAGRITATDRTDFSQVMFRFWPSDGDQTKVERSSASAARSGDFRVDVEIRAGREGQYTVEGFLFWPDAPSQWSRCRLSVMSVVP
ncbi:MAG: hypothetical protein U0P30_01605 [Vicinamibacterales bacterium]